MEHKKKKKYVIIIKSQKQFYKYRVDNVTKTRNWLNNKMPDWLYCNIYDNNTKEYIDNITKYKYCELVEYELKNWNHYED